MNRLRETRGTLGLASILDEGVVHLSGWVAPLAPPSIVGLEVAFGTEVVAPEAMEVARAKSPDVLKAHPRLHDGDRARFYVSIAPVKGLVRFRDCLARVTPMFEDGARGVPLVNLLAPVIAMPSEDAVQSVGGGMQPGFEIFGHLLARLDLQRDMRVLDVGCGIGRMAYPLAYFLSSRATYRGFDIMKDAIGWAKGAFARFPAFRFDHVDIANTRYNPNGKLQSSTFRFPYDDRSFDALYLCSVFTHMLDKDVEHYLDEFVRVLDKGGKALVTCFLLNAESEALIADGKSTQNLVHPLGVAKIADPEVPEASIGFPETWMRQQLERRGLKLLAFCPGSWCGREDWISYQDLLVLQAS